MATKTATPTNGKVELSIPGLDIQVIEVPIVGESPLIVHRFTEKAKGAIEDKQQGKARQGKEKRKPEQEYEACFYRFEDGGYGFPADGFKAALTRGAKYSDAYMTDARGSIHVVADGYDTLTGRDLVRLEVLDGPHMRTDMVRIGRGISDVRYRPEFREWRAVLTVRFNARVFSAAEVINFINVGGFQAGCGEKRPEKGYSNGMWRVES